MITKLKVNHFEALEKKESVFLFNNASNKFKNISAILFNHATGDTI